MLSDREIRMFFKLSDEEKKEEMASYSNEELQQIIMAQSGAAATETIKDTSQISVQVKQLQAQLKAIKEILPDEMAALLNKENPTTNKNFTLAEVVDIILDAEALKADELRRLKGKIAKIEAYEGEKFDDKVERITGMSGQDYYDDVVSKETDLTNYEKHELVKAYVDDVDSISKPMIDFNTGKPIEHQSRVADFWKQHSDKQKNQVAPKTKEVAMDKQFNSFSDF